MTVDVLYLAWNRREFTEQTFALLLANTDWDLVHEVFVYDDRSEDGTSEFLSAAAKELPVPWTICRGRLGSPVEAMNRYVARSAADMFAKLDNDVCVPSGWLEALTGVMDDEPDLELLGMEAGRTWLIGRDGREWDGVYRRGEPCSHIGGVGLMRTDAFRDRPP